MIVAFLQNMWVLPRQVQTVSRWAATSAERERMIHWALFAGCTTGRRLKTALGETLCSAIRWQEASPVVADNARDYYPPDLDHIRAVLHKHDPRIVLGFTRAGDSVIRSALRPGVTFIACPHPACRRVNETMDRLLAVRKEIEGLLQEMNFPWPVTGDCKEIECINASRREKAGIIKKNCYKTE